MTDINVKVDQMNHKLKLKLELYKVMRVIDKTKDIDDDRLKGIIDYIKRYIIELNEENNRSLKNYQHTKKTLFNYVLKNYPDIFTTRLMSSGNQVAAASRPGSTTASSGAIGAGVLYASNLKFDDSIKEKKN